VRTSATHHKELAAPTGRVRWASILGWAAAVLPVMGLVGASLANCDTQPKPYCETTSGTYATKLIEKNRVESQPGACTGLGPASFNADPEVSFETYYPKDDKGQPNYSKPSLAVETTEIANLLAAATVPNEATDGTTISQGAMTNANGQADDNGFCTVPTMSLTHLKLPASGMSPAVDISLTWSNVQVVVTAATIGTQVQADLVDERVTAAGTCTITYKAVALAPAIPCSVTNADGGIEMTPDGSFVTNVTACNPQPDPDAGMFLGSGIGPLTSYECDPALGWCTVTGDSVPALISQ
jgi:hypothetical protein